MNIEQFAPIIVEPIQGKPVANILFSHANGIPCSTYAPFFRFLSDHLQLRIIAYDCRGVGKNTLDTNIILQSKNKSWQILIEDHIAVYKLFEKIYEENWILSGHSMGAWIALLSSERLNISKLWLFDPPILKPLESFQWTLLTLLNQRKKSPNSIIVRRRKRKFTSFLTAMNHLKKTSFMRAWSEESIKNYIDSNYQETAEHGFILRHSPECEARYFEDFFSMSFLGFKCLSKKFRQNLEPKFYLGRMSNTCNPSAKWWVTCFLPNTSWTIIPDGKHMFPLELSNEMKKVLLENIKIK